MSSIQRPKVIFLIQILLQNSVGFIYMSAKSNQSQFGNLFDNFRIWILLKAFTFIGSDGVKYPFLAKAGDDLSLDARVSELFRLFDHFLANDKKSRELNLSLRSYFVVPLGDKKGLIEWIPNLKGFKDCCKPIYIREKRGQWMEWKTDFRASDDIRIKVTSLEPD